MITLKVLDETIEYGLYRLVQRVTQDAAKVMKLPLKESRMDYVRAALPRALQMTPRYDKQFRIVTGPYHVTVRRREETIQEHEMVQVIVIA